jgi:hypothetical protein
MGSPNGLPVAASHTRAVWSFEAVTTHRPFGLIGWSHSMLATNQLAGFDISRSGVSKIEARLRFVGDKDLMFLAEVLKVPIQELFPRRESAGRLSDFMEKLQTTRF